jgi:Glu-tRNA(Gln) amidotransferase subunit E-like FAD-binding protein
MLICSLDKKLSRVQARFTVEDMKQIMATHTLTEKTFKENIQQQLYLQFVKGLAHNIPTIVESNLSGATFTVSGYILSERQMYDLLREMCEMDEQGKQIIMSEINAILYPHHVEKSVINEIITEKDDIVSHTGQVATIRLDENPTD